MRRRSVGKWIIWAGVALGLLLGAGYAYVTRPSALRARLVQLFAQLDLRVLRIGEVSFSPWTGLDVYDLEVAAAEGAPFARSPAVPNLPPLLRVPRTHVRVDPWALLLGKLRLRRVELVSPAIAVIAPFPRMAGMEMPRDLNSLSGPRTTPGDLPRIGIEDADIGIYAVKSGQLRLLRRWVVDAAGGPAQADESKPCAYTLRFDQVAGPVSAHHPDDATLAELRWQGGQLAAELGWADLELVQALLPAEWAASIRTLELSGQACLKPLVLDRGGVASATVHFDNLRFCVPIEDDRDLPGDERFAQVTEAGGVLHYVAAAPREAGLPFRRRGDVHLHVSGQVNRAPAELSMDVFSISYVGDEGGQAKTLGVRGLKSNGYQIDLRADGFALPSAAENPRFASSARLPGVVRSAFRKYIARGPVNFRLCVSRDGSDEGGSEATTRYNGELEVLGATAHYYRFPYIVRDVHGFVRFANDGIRVENLHGRHGAGQLRFDGAVNNTKSWTGFELVCHGRTIATDGELYAALPPEYQRLWEQATPIGLCDVRTTLRRDDGSDETGALDTEIRVEARLLSGTLSLLDGAPLENADGLLRIAGGTVELDDLRGYRDDVDVRVSGKLTAGSAETRQRYDLHVEAANAALHRSSELRDSAGHVIGNIRFDGFGDIWGRASTGEPAQSHYAVRIRDGSLAGFGAGRPWIGTRGWISLGTDEHRILSLTAHRDDGRLTVSGTLPAHLGHDNPITLALDAEDAELERLLPQLVPGRWSSIRAALGLSGRGRLTAQFHPEATGPTGGRQAADIQLEAKSMQPTPVPVELHDITARVTLRANGFQLHEAAAGYGERGRLAVSGRGGWTAGDQWSDFRLEAWDVNLDAHLVEALPQSLAAPLKRLTPQGRMNLTLDQVQMTGSEERVWSAIGRVTLKDAELKVGLPLSAAQGQLSGSCEIRPDHQVALTADFAIDRGRLAARPIERWEGRLVRAPGSSRLRLEDIHGRLCDGDVTGSVELDLNSSTYELSFVLRDVSLEQFLGRDQDKPGRIRQGRLDGHVFVRGSTKEPAERTGGGELRIRGASLLSSPVTASVVEASRRQERPISDEVERAELRFVWEGPELKFSRVDIHSRDLRLVGMGRWNTRSGALSMTLLGATPEDAPRLSPLTELLESAGQELLQYRVEGTASRPRVTIEPLHNLTEPLRKLLRGQEDNG